MAFKKTSSLNEINILSKNRYDNINEFGYDFNLDDKNNIDFNNLYYKPKMFVNKDFIHTKR